MRAKNRAGKWAAVIAAAVIAGAIAQNGALWLRRAMADDHDNHHHHHHFYDHDLARQALERGEIEPLEKMLLAARSEIDGDFIAAELEKRKGVWVYDLKFIDRKGRLRKIHIDAKTAKVISRDPD